MTRHPMTRNTMPHRRLLFATIPVTIVVLSLGAIVFSQADSNPIIDLPDGKSILRCPDTGMKIWAEPVNRRRIDVHCLSLDAQLVTPTTTTTATVATPTPTPTILPSPIPTHTPAPTVTPATAYLELQYGDGLATVTLHNPPPGRWTLDDIAITLDHNGGMTSMSAIAAPLGVLRDAPIRCDYGLILYAMRPWQRFAGRVYHRPNVAEMELRFSGHEWGPYVFDERELEVFRCLYQETGENMFALTVRNLQVSHVPSD